MVLKTSINLNFLSALKNKCAKLNLILYIAKLNLILYIVNCTLDGGTSSTSEIYYQLMPCNLIPAYLMKKVMITFFPGLFPS